MDMIEMLARMWMQCDPNRGGSDPDAVMPPTCDSDGRETTTDLTGQPHWKWFVPRAEATLKFLDAHGFELSLRPTELGVLKGGAS